VHHIPKACNGFGPIAPEIPIDAWVGDAIVKAVDDVLLRDIGDGSSNIEEAMRV
jgi:hypothetical protein